MHELDLDEYNLTSDDLRPVEERRVKGNNMKGHPLVPRLNFEKIFDWRETQQHVEQEDEEEEEEQDEEEMLTESWNLMPQGSSLKTN